MTSSARAQNQRFIALHPFSFISNYPLFHLDIMLFYDRDHSQLDAFGRNLENIYFNLLIFMF